MDWFGTTYEGSRQAGSSLGQGLGQVGAGVGQAAGAIAKPLEERAKRQRTLDMMKQFGLYNPDGSLNPEKAQQMGLSQNLTTGEATIAPKYTNPLETLKDTLAIEKSRKEIEQMGEGTDKDTLGRATILRKEFNTDAAYKNFQILQGSADKMKEAYNLAVSPDSRSKIASDQALAVTFQKMLDPSSVVRESEYARTPEGAAFMSRAGSFVDQFNKGGLRIGDQDRLALIQTANKMLKSGQKQMNSHISRYKSLAKDYNVKPQLILGDIDEFDIPRTFIINKEPYNIPESEAESFLKDNPTAQEI